MYFSYLLICLLIFTHPFTHPVNYSYLLICLFMFTHLFTHVYSSVDSSGSGHSSGYLPGLHGDEQAERHVFVHARSKYKVSWNTSHPSFGLVFAFPDPPKIASKIPPPHRKQVGGAGVVSQNDFRARARSTKYPGIGRTLYLG